MTSYDLPYIQRNTETLLDIATDVIRLLRSAGETVGVAESLTAGGVMAALTSVPGASAAFRGGVVSYATQLKQLLLVVDAGLIAREGVIHADVAAQMAEGARKATTFDGIPTTWGIGTTGVAGPDLQDGKPAGTVFIGIASPEGSRAWGPFCFPGPRERVREATVIEARSRLRDALVAGRSGGNRETMESHHFSRSTLSGLPNEILSLILSNFCLHCREPLKTPHAYSLIEPEPHEYEKLCWYSADCQALHSACLVSRKLRDIAQPILYHAFLPGYRGSCDSQSMQYDWRRRLTTFLRTVARRGDLAAQVRMVYLDDQALEGIEAEADPAIEEAARARGFRLSNFLGPFPRDDMWSVLSPYGPSGPKMTGMILACLPNLTNFSICCISGTILRCLPSSVLRAAGVSSLPLQTIDVIGGCLGDRFDGILEMAAPTLRTLNIFDAELSSGSLARPFPNLRNVGITTGGFGGSEFELLLPGRVGLETCIYEACECCGSPSFSPSHTVELLRSHTETLETLRLDLRFRDTPRLVDGMYLPERIPSLRDFAVLRDLFLNTLYIHNGVDESPDDDSVLIRLLPPSIVSLKLADSMSNDSRLERLAKGLLHLAEAASQGQFPRLQRVRCDTARRLDDYGVGEMFASAGVDFGYNTWPLTMGASRRKEFSKLTEVFVTREVISHQHYDDVEDSAGSVMSTFSHHSSSDDGNGYYYSRVRLDLSTL
ncbi:competence-damaged protein-domain-containing protein [Diplogelasinospora grovesii]|uniref:Competence-damaged protein-domain-containing protein n=1 Tax=Diplogelasinospora grovesii TaxID=303347 RepID=A0AAN6S463_9PEZI|nr:competence-damaged protein-domain-containing protein [Diplogelasinospora grovesii]